MEISCEAEKLFPKIEKIIKKLSDGKSLTEEEDSSFRALLDTYFNIDCPFNGRFCLPRRCSYANPESWINYHGYKSMADLLYYFVYENVKPLTLKNKKSIDIMDAYWAKRSGHYDP